MWGGKETIQETDRDQMPTTEQHQLMQEEPRHRDYLETQNEDRESGIID